LRLRTCGNPGNNSIVVRRVRTPAEATTEGGRREIGFRGRLRTVEGREDKGGESDCDEVVDAFPGELTGSRAKVVNEEVPEEQKLLVQFVEDILVADDGRERLFACGKII